jgi:uncharacterized protein YecE (DUF72 family)
MAPAKRERGTAWIGTSGWSYSHWARGRFYPNGLKPGQWLAFLAGHFNTVELNTSFYRPPRPEYIERWRDQVPGGSGGFRFAIKLWRMITHRKKLFNCRDQLDSFIELFRPLGMARKRGPLLVQLPPSLRPGIDRLDAFLTNLKRSLGRMRWPVTVEFRHRDWICDETCEVLDRHGIAMCLADMPECPATEPNDGADFIYIRRHGPAGDYRGSYSEEQLQHDAKRIRAWLQDGRDVYIYYNNDAEGYAVDNARRLKELVE